jgi:hypothetical protein
MGGRADDCVRQSRVCIRPNVRLQAKVPVMSLLVLANLRVALAVLILMELGVAIKLASTTVPALSIRLRLASVALMLASSCRLSWCSSSRWRNRRILDSSGQRVIPASSLANSHYRVHRHIVQNRFHGRVRQAKPLLHEVNAQHGGHCKGRSTRFARGRVRIDQGHQISPGNHLFNFIRKFTLARSLGGQLETRVAKPFCFIGI